MVARALREQKRSLKLTNSGRCHLSDFPDVLISLHDPLDPCHRELGLHFDAL